MFYRGSFFLRVLAALLLIGGLVIGGVLIFQAGQAIGYTQGAALSYGEVPAQPPGAPYYPGYAWPQFGFFPFLILPLLCLGGLALLAVLALGGFFRYRVWGCPPKGAQTGAAWQGWHAHPHPWGPPPWATQSEATEPKAEEGVQASSQEQADTGL
jgi:hypothetical protein